MEWAASQSECHPAMSETIPAPDGATRLFLILGDPIAQVKAPGGISLTFAARGVHAMLLPLHIAAADLRACVAGLSRARNLDGLVVTVPHKIAMAGHCATLSPRARLLGSVNLLRRNPDGGWHGDMSDGEGMLAAIRAAGGSPRGQRALLVGAGGAGSAIGLALVDAGLAALAIHDAETTRRDRLVALLGGRGAAVGAGGPDPRGYDLVINATPAGMRAGDPLPIAAEGLAPSTFVADVITMPEETPLLAAARARGCPTATGVDMFKAQQALIADFLLGA